LLFFIVHSVEQEEPKTTELNPKLSLESILKDAYNNIKDQGTEQFKDYGKNSKLKNYQQKKLQKNLKNFLEAHSTRKKFYQD
jgi:hypothetical protein